jgi:hypothetical protein
MKLTSKLRRSLARGLSVLLRFQKVLNRCLAANGEGIDFHLPPLITCLFLGLDLENSGQKTLRFIPPFEKKSIILFDGLVKSVSGRHPGESRGPELAEIAGFRISPRMTAKPGF